MCPNSITGCYSALVNNCYTFFVVIESWPFRNTRRLKISEIISQIFNSKLSKFQKVRIMKKLVFGSLSLEYQIFWTPECRRPFRPKFIVPESWNFHRLVFKYSATNSENFSLIGQDLATVLLSSLYKGKMFHTRKFENFFNAPSQISKKKLFYLETSTKVLVFRPHLTYFELGVYIMDLA